MVVQAIWLKGAVEVRNERFDNAVAESLTKISRKIQENSYHNVMHDLFTQSEIMIDFFDKSYEATQIKTYATADGNRQYHHVKVNDVVDTVITIDIDLSDKNHDGAQYVYSKEYSGIEDGQLPKWELGVNIAESPISVTISPDEIKKTLLKQKEALSKMMYEQMFNLSPIMEVIDTNTLEKIIKETLGEYGIKTDVHYGIIEAKQDNFVFASSKSCINDLYDSKYGVEIANRSFFKMSKYLILTFPNKNRYLLNSLWLPLSSSGLFFNDVNGFFRISIIYNF